jgi:ribosomal protein S1
MSQKPRSEKDPIQAELEAALAGASLLDIDLELGGRGKGPVSGNAEGDLRKGVIVGIDGDDVIVELGPRMQGVIPPNEFDTPPKVGESYEFSLHGQKDGLWVLSRRKARLLAAWNQLEVGAHVEGTVKSVNSGGLEVSIGQLTAFMPASQASDHHVDDLSRLVGEKMAVEVLELDPKKKRVVVSRRKVLGVQREERRREIAGSLAVGDKVKGTVMRVETFGAFVDIGGVEGLVHVSQISRRRIENAADVLKPGQSVDAEVVKIEEGGRRIGLSMKALEPDPWAEAAAKYTADSVYPGKVVRVAEFGAFVELEPGVDGLVHVSQINGGGGERVRNVGDKLPVGKVVDVRVVAVDSRARRISLSCLDSHGAVLGSEESASGDEVRLAVSQIQAPKPIGTNLGDLLKRSMKK